MEQIRHNILIVEAEGKKRNIDERKNLKYISKEQEDRIRCEAVSDTVY
jgi:hypothetical protein